MNTKICFKCGVDKPLSEYYKHKPMKDGHLNKCKQCTKKDSTKHRNDNLEKVREYDRQRGSLPHRVQARKEYSLTPNGIKAHRKARKKYASENAEKMDLARKRYVQENPEKIAEAHKKYAEKYPDKALAHNKVGNAIRDGRLDRPDECEICGKFCKPHAHHWSYKEENWLDVQWLCVQCHVELHAELREMEG